MSRLTTYFKETKAEMKHVSWPTRKQAIMYTIVVIIISLGTSAYLGFFDYVFSTLLKLVI
ncbi:MAG: Preprotein translocase, SecE subunit [Parcubacteria group bacterium GW2011_GWA2_49_9]|nr:MAG: Preprotein translocase, SecE subunit [Parcubacteria group bacterium GW2011_GWA2_49_9]